MKKVGQLLRSEREKRGLSLHEIGMSLKINPKILQSIEEGSSEGLPAKTFLRGFIRSYAQYLRLDVEQVLTVYQNESAPVREESAPGSTSETSEASASPVRVERLSRKNDEPAIPSMNSGKKIYTIVGAIVLLLAIGFVVRMIEKYKKESEIIEVQNATPIDQTPEIIDNGAGGTTPPAGEQNSTPVGGDAATDTTTTTSTTLLGAAAAGSTTTTLATTTTVTTTTRPVTTTTVAPTTTTTTKPPVTTTTKPVVTTTTTTKPPTTTTTTTTRPVTTTTTTRPVTTTTTTTKPPTTTTTTTKPPTTTTRPVTTTTVVTATTTPVKSEGKPVEVIAEATAAVTVRYDLGEGGWQTVQLSAGQIHTFKGKAGITMEVSDGGALNVIVNGRDRGTAGSTGKPAKLTY